MTDRFKDVPLEEDTRLTGQKIITIGDLEALRQRWTWEGIRAQSLIFYTDEVRQLSDDDLKALTREVPWFGTGHEGAVTIVRQEKYTFVNFDFETPP